MQAQQSKKKGKQMIDKVLQIGSLPKGEILVTTIENKTIENKKWRDIIKTIPLGVGKIGSIFKYIILAEDAIEFGIPHNAVNQIVIN
jgi:hypothetical protein